MTSARTRPVPVDRRRSLLVGAMIGIAVMAAADTIVFHQLLSWHHFYDRSTRDMSLLSDGLLQTTYLALLVAGFFWFADLRRRRTLARRSAWAGFVLGLGAFQLFDGIVDHKLLKVHQIRYDVDVLPYDLAWNGAAVALLVLGAVLAWRSRDEGRIPPAEHVTGP
ncbi:MAG: rane protein [Modestobacter sp.]|nr:rane protein [Modestobacter sp.]